MRFIHRVAFRIRALFEGRRREADLDEELKFHLDGLRSQYRKAGMSEEEAGAAALRTFGNVTLVKEEYREGLGVRLVKDAFQDVRYGARMLWISPGFAATSILTLALGIGAATAIFSVVYGVALRPLPYPESSRLVTIYTRADRLGTPRAPAGPANFRDWRAQAKAFEEMALVRNIFNANLTGDGEPERVQGALVTANLFKTLQVQPVLGRAFFEEEEEIGPKSAVVILSDDLWRRRFGGDRGVVGKAIMINGRSNTIVGIMGPGFHYPGREFQLWQPLVVNPDDYRTRMNYSFIAVARLKPGVSASTAQVELETISLRLAQQYPASNEGISAVVSPMLEDTAAGVSRGLFVLLGAVLCLLLTACANMANLLLARAIARGHELNIRAALGAGGARLLRQSVMEILPIAMMGGVLGVFAASWAVSALIPLLPSTMPRVEEIEVSGPVLLFSFSILVLTALIVGTLPAFQVGRSDLAASLQESSRGSSSGRGRARLRDVIVAGQVAAAVVLVVASGLLIRSYSELRSVDPGFDSSRILSLHLAIPRSKYPRDDQVAAFCQSILDRVTALHDVVSAGMVNRLPLGGVPQIGIIEGERPDGTMTSNMPTDWRTVTPDYFKAIGIPLKKGRSFGAQDNGQWFDRDLPKTQLVGIVDEKIAEAFWPNQDPIGRRFRIDPDLPWTEVIGVVGHIRNDRIDADVRPQVYWNFLQRAQDRAVLVVRTKGDPESLVSSIIGAIRGVDPEQPVYDVRPMEEVIERSVSPQWLISLLLGMFAGASLLLTSIGIYGVISYSASQRVREFGIRMALGAGRSDLFGFVLRQAGVLVGIGTGVGVAVAWMVTRILSRLLFNVSPTDWLTYSLSIAALIVVALLSAYVPARRAANTDPVSALR